MNETSAAEFEALHLRVNALRVAAIFQIKGEPVPPGAAGILEHDSLALQERDTAAYQEDWCERHGLECPLFLNGDYQLDAA